MIMAFTVDVKCAIVFAVTIPVLSAIVFGIIRYTIPRYKGVQNQLDTITLNKERSYRRARYPRFHAGKQGS